MLVDLRVVLCITGCEGDLRMSRVRENIDRKLRYRDKDAWNRS